MKRHTRLYQINPICGALLVLLIGILAVPVNSGLGDPQEKVESTDPALRLKWFAHHQTLKDSTFVWDLIVHPRDNVLVIATYGRGMWAIDKVSDIQKHKSQ